MVTSTPNQGHGVTARADGALDHGAFVERGDPAMLRLAEVDFDFPFGIQAHPGFLPGPDFDFTGGNFPVGVPLENHVKFFRQFGPHPVAAGDRRNGAVAAANELHVIGERGGVGGVCRAGQEKNTGQQQP